jgi:hypothetical protein
MRSTGDDSLVSVPHRCDAADGGVLLDEAAEMNLTKRDKIYLTLQFSSVAIYLAVMAIGVYDWLYDDQILPWPVLPLLLVGLGLDATARSFAARERQHLDNSND